MVFIRISFVFLIERELLTGRIFELLVFSEIYLWTCSIDHRS